MRNGKYLGIRWKRMTKIHDFKANLDFGNLEILWHNLLILVKPTIVGSIQKVHFPNYKTEKELEQKGIDLQIITNVKKHKYQGKLRRDTYWGNRGIGFFIEIKNSIRPNGRGWFYNYRGENIDYFILGWTSPTNGFYYFEVYDNSKDRFFNIIEKIDRKYNFWRPTPHRQNVNGRDVGETSGFIFPLKYIKSKLRVNYKAFLS